MNTMETCEFWEQFTITYYEGQEKYPEVPMMVWAALTRKIVENQMDYVNPVRAYRVQDSLYKEKFEESIANGCCGEFLMCTTDHNKDEWIVGCNYGH